MSQEKHSKRWKRHVFLKYLSRILAGILLLATLLAAYLIIRSRLMPKKFMVPILGIMGFFAALTLLLAFVRRKWTRRLSVVLSILCLAVLSAGAYALHAVNSAMEDVGGSAFQKENMVIVTLSSDPAEDIFDVVNYKFGKQTAIAPAHSDIFIADIENKTGKILDMTAYDDIVLAAQALLDGDVQALVYDQALEELILDEIEEFDQKIKVIYQFGISEEIEMPSYDAKSGQDATVANGVFNVLISGSDARSSDISVTSRSDVNIIATVNMHTHHILLTTTPRDYYVPLSGISGEMRDKLTHAGVYGVHTSAATLSELYDTPISYYAKINFTTLTELVDILGGVDVYSEIAFTGVHGEQFVEGWNHLDGEAALSFSRERHAFADGDNQRGKNQEIVLKGILEKMASPAVIPKAFTILDQIGAYFATNMTRDEMAVFVNEQLANPVSWTIEMQAATGTVDTQETFSMRQPLSVMWPDEESVRYISERISDVMRGF